MAERHQIEIDFFWPLMIALALSVSGFFWAILDVTTAESVILFGVILVAHWGLVRIKPRLPARRRFPVGFAILGSVYMMIYLVIRYT